jgi:hypothetical protein
MGTGTVKGTGIKNKEIKIETNNTKARSENPKECIR